MQASVVKLIFKKGDRQQMGDYRLLLLACTDYKTPEKVVTERIKTILKKIVGTEQHKFIQVGV